MNCDVDRLQRIEDKLDAIRMSLAEVSGMVPILAQRVERLEREVWGNGRVGLTVKVNTIVWLAWVITGLVTVSAGSTVRMLLGF
jgi:hypothetical protein